jgi:hypothetical protein
MTHACQLNVGYEIVFSSRYGNSRMQGWFATNFPAGETRVLGALAPPPETLRIQSPRMLSECRDQRQSDLQVKRQKSRDFFHDRHVSSIAEDSTPGGP